MLAVLDVPIAFTVPLLGNTSSKRKNGKGKKKYHTVRKTLREAILTNADLAYLMAIRHRPWTVLGPEDQMRRLVNIPEADAYLVQDAMQMIMKLGCILTPSNKANVLDRMRTYCSLEWPDQQPQQQNDRMRVVTTFVSWLMDKQEQHDRLCIGLHFYRLVYLQRGGCIIPQVIYRALFPDIEKQADRRPARTWAELYHAWDVADYMKEFMFLLTFRLLKRRRHQSSTHVIGVDTPILCEKFKWIIEPYLQDTQLYHELVSLYRHHHLGESTHKKRKKKPLRILGVLGTSVFEDWLAKSQSTATVLEAEVHGNHSDFIRYTIIFLLDLK